MYEQPQKSKRHILHRLIASLLVLCCFAVITGIIGFVIKNPSATVDFINANLTSSAQNTADVIDDETAWCLILVNKWHTIPKDYEVSLTLLTNGQSVDTRIYPALQEMFDAARSSGVYPIVASGYRTAGEQQNLLDEKIAAYKAEGYSTKEAITQAEAWVAPPGTSEHQLGIAVDINADNTISAEEEVYNWLAQNSYKFGFIRRYPADKTEITNVINEPWHYRYVGLEAATAIYNQGLCLEEYLDRVR